MLGLHPGTHAPPVICHLWTQLRCDCLAPGWGNSVTGWFNGKNREYETWSQKRTKGCCLEASNDKVNVVVKEALELEQNGRRGSPTLPCAFYLTLCYLIRNPSRAGTWQAWLKNFVRRSERQMTTGWVTKWHLKPERKSQEESYPQETRAFEGACVTGKEQSHPQSLER